MAKVTLNVNLFPCSRDLPSGPYTDLTEDLERAELLVLAATKMYWFKRGSVHFSGYTMDGGEELTIQVWHGQKMFRATVFPTLNYGGLLRVDVKTAQWKDAVGCDVLEDLYKAEHHPDPVIPVRFSGRNRYPGRNMRQRQGFRRRDMIMDKLADFLEKQEV